MKGTLKAYNVRLPDWMEDDVIGDVKNKTVRIQELIIKGYIAEQKAMNKKPGDGAAVIASRVIPTFLEGVPALALA